MFKQLWTPTHFLTLPWADIKKEELPYIINKSNNLGYRHEEPKNLCYQELCNLLSNNPVLVARHFQYRVEVFFKEIILDGPFGITKYYAIRIEFKKGVTQMYILLREFSMDQIFKMKLPRLLRLLRKQ